MEIISCEKQESFVVSGLDLFYNSLPPSKNPRKENAISGEERDKGLFEGLKKINLNCKSVRKLTVSSPSEHAAPVCFTVRKMYIHHYFLSGPMGKMYFHHYFLSEENTKNVLFPPFTKKKCEEKISPLFKFFSL